MIRRDTTIPLYRLILFHNNYQKFVAIFMA